MGQKSEHAGHASAHSKTPIVNAPPSFNVGSSASAHSARADRQTVGGFAPRCCNFS